ncbi:hypothetical protein RIF29_24753 [Crotalaria pallida]|uniref:Uncharacterized protein n=1 Tax=Crotalaria pallida TaxID=3830 RepID=A0AAN9EKC7_CROPI
MEIRITCMQGDQMHISIYYFDRIFWLIATFCVILFLKECVKLSCYHLTFRSCSLSTNGPLLPPPPPPLRQRNRKTAVINLNRLIP